MIARGNRATRRALSMFLIATILLIALCVASAQSFKKSHKIQKLCSRRLSDALYIVCQDRGYNGPFPSDEDDTEVDPTGPGLVEECCYHQCTYETLERYCKPLPKDKQVDSREAIIEEFILKLPHSVSTTKELSAEQRSQTETDNADNAIKRKVDDLKEGHHKGKGDRNVDGVCKGKADAKKRHCGRHCRCRRRRLKCRRAGKILRGNAKSCAV